MKTIEISDENYEFLMNLKNELNTQDCRITASPYYYTIRQKKKVYVPDGCGNEVIYRDETELETKEDCVEYLLDYYEDEYDKDDLNDMSLCELFDILIEERGFSPINYNYEYYYSNVFLTEKACEHHISINKHNLGLEPVSYVDHAYRNPEMEKLLKILKTIE